MMTGKAVVVYSEDRELGLQILSKGREISDKLGGKLSALVIGAKVTDPEEYIAHGADRVLVVDDPALKRFAAEAYKGVALEALKDVDLGILLIGATKRGKELAARVSAALDTGCMTECIGVDVDEEGRLLGQRLTYGGSVISSQVSAKEPHVATIPPRTFKKADPAPREGEISVLDVDIQNQRVKVVESREKARGDAGLAEAPIVVSAGRGFKDKADLRLLEELAEVLGAKIGCSRPIAADLGWMEEWIGISGYKISPKLYIACGISGTIQHAAGIRDAQIIVSVNSEEGANIHEISDYSIVGDIYTVIPALTKALREKMG